MKWLLVVAVIAGCLAQLDASRIVRRTSSGEAAGNAFFANANSGDTDGALEAAGGTIGGGGNDDDGGGDTPDGPDSPDGGGLGVAAAGGGGNEVGDTPDGIDTPDDSPRRGNGRPVLKNAAQSPVVDDQGEQAGDPGQIVGATSNAGATAGIVVGVVALVGLAAGVAIYVIKKRN